MPPDSNRLREMAEACGFRARYISSMKPTSGWIATRASALLAAWWTAKSAARSSTPSCAKINGRCLSRQFAAPRSRAPCHQRHWERPAIVHLRDFKLNGFTTGAGVLAPRLSLDLYNACVRKDYPATEEIRRAFLPLEDLRGAWGAARVLHAAVEAAGLAETGPIPPFVSAVPALQIEQLRHVACALLERNG